MKPDMFETFTTKFSADSTPDISEMAKNEPTEPAELQQLFGQFSGTSFNDGLYRIIRRDDLAAWNERLTDAFPDAKDRINCFGIDWLGRVFACDIKHSRDGKSGVLMFEPGTGQVLQIPVNVTDFHNDELIHASDAALAEPFYRAWIESGGRAPNFAEAIGYKRPVFMNGKDDIENLAPIDSIVYWGICTKFINAVRDLPPGTPVDHLSV